TGPGIENRLHQALIFAERNGLAIGEKRETPDSDLATFGLGLRLGQDDGSYLRMAMSAARNFVLVHRMGIEALDLFHADDAFMLGLMGQHRRASNIADCIDAGHIGATEAIYQDRPLVNLDAQRFEPEILDVASDTDRRDHAVDGDFLSLAALLDRRGDG